MLLLPRGKQAHSTAGVDPAMPFHLYINGQQPPLYTRVIALLWSRLVHNYSLTMLRSNHILFTYHLYTSLKPKASWWGIVLRDSSSDYTPFDRVDSPLLNITTSSYHTIDGHLYLVRSQLETNRTAYTYISWLPIISSSSSKQRDRREWQKKEKFRTGM